MQDRTAEINTLHARMSYLRQSEDGCLGYQLSKRPNQLLGHRLGRSSLLALRGGRMRRRKDPLSIRSHRQHCRTPRGSIELGRTRRAPARFRNGQRQGTMIFRRSLYVRLHGKQRSAVASSIHQLMERHPLRLEASLPAFRVRHR